jgi:hypothetical protein
MYNHFTRIHLVGLQSLHYIWANILIVTVAARAMVVMVVGSSGGSGNGVVMSGKAPDAEV